MINSYTYPDHRFNIQIITVEYQYGCKPENLLMQLNGIGWKENRIVRNSLMEIPGCVNEYSLAITIDQYNKSILNMTKGIIQNFGGAFKAHSKSPKSNKF